MKRSDLADAWLRQAKSDLTGAEAMSNAGLWDKCATMCQQCIEKAVKALWIDVKGGLAPRTHWVATLAIELGAPRDVAEAVNRCVADYLSSRYPDATPTPPSEVYTAADAQGRLADARKALHWAEDQW